MQWRYIVSNRIHIWCLKSEKNCCICFFFLKKTYDTVNHNILLSQLSSYGIRGTELQCYLRNRSQCIKVNCALSVYTTVSIVIQHDSVIGGLLFLTYINDLPAVSNNLFNVLFADDTCLAHAHHDFTKMIDEFNTELWKKSYWLITKGSSLNILKTVDIDFSNIKHEEHSIKLNGVTLDYSDYVKYLRVYLDKNLSFQKQINIICINISESIGIVHRISFFCPKLVLMNFFTR